jgi:hypothetical protein
MNVPGFTAETTLDKRNATRAIANTPAPPADLVVPQDCGFWKQIACSWPISGCAPAAVGGAAAYIDCVDTASDGWCVDCVLRGGIDPRGTPKWPPHKDSGLTSPHCRWE